LNLEHHRQVARSFQQAGATPALLGEEANDLSVRVDYGWAVLQQDFLASSKIPRKTHFKNAFVRHSPTENRPKRRF
jgi:hypothetical protein